MALLKAALDEREALLSELDTDDSTDISLKESVVTADNSERSQAPHKSKADQTKLKVSHLKGLITVIEEEFEPYERKLDALKNDITFDLLWRLFPQDSEIVFKDLNSGCNCIGKVFP